MRHACSTHGSRGATRPAAALGAVLALVALLADVADGYRGATALGGAGVRAAAVSPARARGAVRLSETTADEAPAAAAATAAAGAGEEAALTPAPASFELLLTQAQNAVSAAISDGYKLLEVEFPPLPTSVLEDPSSSAYDVSDANVRLAARFAKGLGKRTAILLPDRPELERAVKVAGNTARPYPDVSLHSLTATSSVLSSTDGDAAGPAPGGVEGFFSGIFNLERIGQAEVQPVPEAELYVVIVASCQELPDVERLSLADPDTPVVLFNLKLDTQRGDLGLPAFPRKALHHRWLSYAKPAYLLRSRSYTLSLARPPFILPFSGALFRCYPGPYQTLLDTGKGSFRLVEAVPDRPPLGTFKESLRQALKIDEQEKGKPSDVLTRGYKTQTWWEEDNDKLDESDNWRT